MKASLILSGGAALGMAHVGALKVLEDRYDFDYYAGVSAGAMIGAAHACGKTAEDIAKILHSLRVRDFLFDRASTNFGVVRGQKVFELLEKEYEGRTFEDIEKEGKKLRVYATDFVTGKRVCFNSGNIAKAVMASISIPVVFQPVEYQDRFLVDGMLSGNFPIIETMDEYKGNCIGVDVIADSLDENIDLGKKSFLGKRKGLPKTMERMFRILVQHQNDFEINDPRVNILKPKLSAFRTADIRKLKAIEKIGYEAANKHFGQ